MKTDLTNLGDASWWVTATSEEKIAEPQAGYIQTVTVDNYSRPCVLFFAAGRVRPRLGQRVRIQVKNGELIFPLNRNSKR